MLADNNNRKSINRREFIAFAWGVSMLGLFGQAGVALLRFIRPRIEAGAFGSKVTAGRVEEFQPGSVSHIQKGRFYITRLEDGGFLALWHRCTHLGCTIPWMEDEGRFHCPCHSSIFTATGEVVSGPAPRPMDIFPVEISEGNVIVDTGTAVIRQKYEPSQAVKA